MSSNVRYTATADLAALREYVALIERAREAVEGLNAAGGASGGGGGGGQQNTGGGGSPSPTPPGPRNTGGEGGNDAPPSPTSPGRPNTGGGASGGSGDDAKEGVHNMVGALTGITSGGAGGIGSSIGALLGTLLAGPVGGAVGGFAGGQVGGMAGKVGGAASAYFGMGLGQSPMGFLMGSGEKYLALSRTLTEVRQRFRGAEESAISMGASMGFTVERAAQLATTLGSLTNTVGSFDRYAGMARFFGVDQGTAMSALGGIERMQHAPVSRMMMASMGGLAERQGMSRGRMGEFMQTVQQAVEQVAMATGQTTGAGAGGLNVMRQAGFTMGMDSPFGQGQRGMQLMGRLNQTMQGPTMQTYLMRAMGYGTDPNLSYLDAMERAQAGVNDPRNLATLFGSFQARGMTEADMSLALWDAGGGSMKVWESRKIAQALSTPEKLEAFQRAMATGNDADAVNFIGRGLNAKDRKRLLSGGFVGLGRGHIATGEARAVTIEGMQMELGADMSKFMSESVDQFRNLLNATKNILGSDLGTSLLSLSKSVTELTAKFAKWTGDEDNAQRVQGLATRPKGQIAAEGAQLINVYILGNEPMTSAQLNDLAESVSRIPVMPTMTTRF